MRSDCVINCVIKEEKMEKRLFVIFLILDSIALIVSGTNMIFSFLPDWAVRATGCVISACILVLAILLVRKTMKTDNGEKEKENE